MSEMIVEVYDALVAAGAPDDKARAAATAVAGMKDEPWRRKIEAELENIRGTQRLHSWILGTNTAMLTAILFKLFS